MPPSTPKHTKKPRRPAGLGHVDDNNRLPYRGVVSKIIVFPVIDTAAVVTIQFMERL